MPRCDEDRVVDGLVVGLRISDPSGEAVVLCAEVGILGSPCSRSRCAEMNPEPMVSLADPSGLALAGRLVVPRMHPAQDARCPEVAKRLMSTRTTVAFRRSRQQSRGLAGGTLRVGGRIEWTPSPREHELARRVRRTGLHSAGHRGSLRGTGWLLRGYRGR